MDRLQSMRAFVKVVETGSFVRAAQALELSNAVVTRLVSDLERYLAGRLLNRTTRKLSLTEAGATYFDRIQAILDAIDEADALASNSSREPAGLLRIYSTTIFGQSIISDLLPEYCKRYPRVVPDITLSDRVPDFIGDRFDVGIFSEIQSIEGTMVMRQLVTTTYMLCAAPSYVKKYGMPATLDELSAHNCLNFSTKGVRESWPVIEGNGIVQVSVNSKMYSNDSEMLRKCALRGMGLLITPSYAVYDDLVAGRLIRILPQYASNKGAINIVYPSRRLLPASVRTFVDYLVGRFPSPDNDPWV